MAGKVPTLMFNLCEDKTGLCSCRWLVPTEPCLLELRLEKLSRAIVSEMSPLGLLTLEHWLG